MPERKVQLQVAARAAQHAAAKTYRAQRFHKRTVQVQKHAATAHSYILSRGREGDSSGLPNEAVIYTVAVDIPAGD
jgi:hypothetical protein